MRVVVRAAAHRDVSAAIGLARDDRDLWHGGQTGRVHEVHDMTGRSAAFGIKADDEAGRIHHANERNVEAVAQHREVDDFAACIGG